MAHRILVMDQDAPFAQTVQSYLEKKGFDADTATTAEKAADFLGNRTYSLFILSIAKSPSRSGCITEFLGKAAPPRPCLFITKHGAPAPSDISNKQPTRSISTPVNHEELLRLVEELMDHSNKKTSTKSAAQSKAQEVRSITSSGKSFDFVNGVSAQTKLVNEHVELVGPTNMSVLIQGESGTGKEYVARKIHEHSKRKDKAFVAIDCGALSRDLAASELFGHVKGSFTGASADRAGQFEVANGGTLFLDEIGNLSYEVQIKLLRAIQEKVIRRVGGREDISVDVRLVTATNENLATAIAGGGFREDLYHRINEFKIDISPLRVREKEIVQFAHYFLKHANTELEKDVEGFDEETLRLFRNYRWPGNLRELKNVVKRSVLLTKGKYVEKNALPSEILSAENGDPASSDLNDSTDLKQLERKMERQKIMEALQKVHYNKTKAAKLLNIDRKTLYNKIRSYGLEV